MSFLNRINYRELTPKQRTALSLLTMLKVYAWMGMIVIFSSAVDVVKHRPWAPCVLLVFLAIMFRYILIEHRIISTTLEEAEERSGKEHV